MRKHNTEISTHIALINNGTPADVGCGAWESSDSGTDQFQGLFDNE